MINISSKFYAVKNGRTKGIYLNWDDCKKQVDGFPAAKYKSFESITEAAQFLLGDMLNKKIPSNAYSAYVDGSYDPPTGRYSCGVLILNGDNVVDKFYRVGDNREAASMRNVAGEILGAELAIKYAVEHNYKSLIIYHDYTGISEWANKNWQAKNKHTQKYAAYIDHVRKNGLDLYFVKVKGHSGDVYNDMADSLAKEALSNIADNSMNGDV